MPDTKPNTESSQVKIKFEGLSVDEAGERADELRDALLDLNPDINARIQKESKDTQDFGATLVLVLGAPAVVVIAKGIKDYLDRVGGTITVEVDGKVRATGIRGSDVARITEAISKRK